MTQFSFLEFFFKSEVVKCFMYFKRVRYNLYLKSSSVLFQILMSNYLVLKLINVFMRHGKKHFAFSSFLKAMLFLRRHGVLNPISDLCRVLYENEAFFDYKWIIPFSKKKAPFQLTRIIEGKSRWLLPLRFLRKEYVRMEYELFRLFLLKKRNVFKFYFIRLAFFFFRIIKIHFSFIRIYFLKRAWYTLKSLRKGKKKKSKHIIFSELLSIRNKRRVLSVRSKMTKWNWTRGFNWRRHIFRARRRFSTVTVSSSSVGFKRRNRKLWWGLRPVGRHLKKRLSLGK